MLFTSKTKTVALVVSVSSFDETFACKSVFQALSKALLPHQFLVFLRFHSLSNIAVIRTTQAVVKLKPFRALTGFEPMTSAIPVKFSTN